MITDNEVTDNIIQLYDYICPECKIRYKRYFYNRITRQKQLSVRCLECALLLLRRKK